MNKFQVIWNKVFETNWGAEIIPDYPSEFLLIDYSPIALKENILDDQNKLIYQYTYNFFLQKYEIKKLRYSEARLKAIQEVKNIPFFDKTKFEQRFPVWAKILPSEITYSQ